MKLKDTYSLEGKLWHIVVEYYSAIKKNAFEFNEVDEIGAYLEREVSQKVKHQYSILTHIYGI